MFAITLLSPSHDKSADSVRASRPRSDRRGSVTPARTALFTAELPRPRRLPVNGPIRGPGERFDSSVSGHSRRRGARSGGCNVVPLVFTVLRFENHKHNNEANDTAMLGNRSGVPPSLGNVNGRKVD